MRAFLRSCIVLLLLSTGCATTGGKVLGTTAVVTGIASILLMSSSRATLENGQAVLADDHMDAGAGLMFVSIAAASGWFLTEYVFGGPFGGTAGGGGGGGGGFPASADPSGEAVAAPAPAPAPVEDSVAPAPVTVVVQAPDRGGRDQPRAGWHLEGDQDELLNRDGELVIRIDGAGAVWLVQGGVLGRVDMSGNCDAACRRAQAHQMLDAYEAHRH